MRSNLFKRRSTLSHDEAPVIFSTKLAAFKIPVNIKFCTSNLPKVGSGKFDKPNLREQFLKEFKMYNRKSYFIKKKSINRQVELKLNYYMSKKILLIEDEPDIRKTLEYNLSREGYGVISTSSLAEGRNSLESNSFSLILLDLMLPDGSGLDLCREIKSDKIFSSIPIIILTAKDDEVDKVVGFELGADDYVTKPFSVRELILRVKASIKKSDVKIR